MSKLLWIAVFLTLIAVGLCNNDEHTDCRYDLKDNNTTCVIMNASITITVGYEHIDNAKSYVDILITCDEDDGELSVDGKCNEPVNDKKFTTMTYNMTDFILTFVFVANGNHNWNVENISVTILTHNNTELPNPKYPGEFTGSKNSSLFGDGFDYQRSYMCNAANNMSLTMDTAKNVNASNYEIYLTISNFRVQAFQFDNDANPSYGNAQRCSQDIKGSKIVPIAVGAALAGLVIIVLIAYIIGRLRSRRQSSYEALS